MAKTLVSVYYELQELQEMKAALADEARTMRVTEVPHFHVILELERLWRADDHFGRELKNKVRARLLSSRLARKTLKALGRKGRRP